MAIFSDVPKTPEEREAYIDRALSDPSRLIVLTNEFERFDYVTAKENLLEFVQLDYSRINDIVNDMMGAKDGDSSESVRAD